jgi:hypothetical protein
MVKASRKLKRKSRSGRKRTSRKSTRGVFFLKRKNNMTRRRSLSLKGGYGPGAGPIGYPWKDVCTWPGVRGIDSQSNYLPLSPTGIQAGLLDPQPMNMNTSNTIYPFGAVGGGRRGRRKYIKNKKGGGMLTNLFPQDIVDFGRSLTGTSLNVYDGFKGTPPPLNRNPYPYVQPYISGPGPGQSTLPPKINEIHQMAGQQVANI